MATSQRNTSKLPGFLRIITGDNALPVAVAWTLDDGRLKHTLIQPLESWLEDDSIALDGYDETTLHAMGVRPLDVIRELETDHDSETLFISGFGEEEEALERMYEEYGLNPVVELAPAYTLYPGMSFAEWEEERRQIMEERGLDAFNPEHEVAAMLFLHARLAEEWPEHIPRS